MSDSAGARALARKLHIQRRHRPHDVSCLQRGVGNNSHLGTQVLSRTLNTTNAFRDAVEETAPRCQPPFLQPDGPVGSGGRQVEVARLIPPHAVDVVGERIYVLDELGPRLLVFTLEGTLIGQLGGPGEGPGE